MAAPAEPLFVVREPEGRRGRLYQREHAVRTRGDVVDDLLVLASQAGDASAFERLAARWHPRLVRHARRLTGDADAASDVVQDAWIAVARGLPRLRDPSRFGAWALRIAGRRAADWIGRRVQARTRMAAADAAPKAAALDTPADDRIALIRAAFRALAAPDRLLVTLYYVDGYSVAEAAVILGVPAGTVKSRLFHARERLRAELEVSDGAHNRR
jgi:RNA polymerase sigma-70 factor (ECF subfamily)